MITFEFHPEKIALAVSIEVPEEEVEGFYPFVVISISFLVFTAEVFI